MGRPPSGRTESTPQSQPVTTPSLNQPTHDFTLQVVVQMQNTLGGISTRIEDLRDAQKELAKTQGEIDKRLAVFDTTLKIGAALLALFLTAFWFWFGGDIETLRKMSMKAQVDAAAAAAAAPPTQ